MIDEIREMIENRFLSDISRVIDSLENVEVELYNKIFEGIEEDFDDIII